MVKNRIKGHVTKIDGFQLLVAVTGDFVLDAAGVLYLLLFYSYLLKIVCNLNFWC